MSGSKYSPRRDDKWSKPSIGGNKAEPQQSNFVQFDDSSAERDKEANARIARQRKVAQEFD